MRIALLQFEAVPGEIDRNLDVLRRKAVIARAEGASLILTPELFVTGYAPELSGNILHSQTTAKLADMISNIARDTEIAIATSFPRPTTNHEGLYIGAGLWDEHGKNVLQYNKVHLWGPLEQAAFIPGTEAPQVAFWNGWKVSFQVCYDVEFPEPTRFAASDGAQLLLVPTAIGNEARYVPELLVPARATENGMHVAYCDFPSTADSPFIGMSTVAAPAGKILIQGGPESSLLYADLPSTPPSPDLTADYLNDRKPELYDQW